MSAIAQRSDMDYRVIFRIEELFERRMIDIYFSMSSQKNIPFIEDIFNDLWDVMVLAFVASIKDTPLYNELDMKQIAEIERTGDPHSAAEFIFKYADEHFCDLFHRDVYLFLIEKQMNFFIKPLSKLSSGRDFSRLINPTIVEVW